MIEAWERSDGMWLLYGKTYAQRERIKQAGGMWDANLPGWIVTTEIADALGYPRKVRRRVKDSICGAEDRALVPADAQIGDEVRFFCAHCDSHTRGPIIG